MKAAVAVLLIAFASITLAIPPPPTPMVSSRGSVVWWPQRFEGWKIFSVTRLEDERIEVYANPRYIYQDATVTGALITGAAVTTRYLEIRAALKRGQPDPWPRGFRDPRSVRHFPMLEYSTASSDGRLEVWADGAQRWLVVMDKIARHQR